MARELIPTLSSFPLLEHPPSSCGTFIKVILVSLLIFSSFKVELTTHLFTALVGIPVYLARIYWDCGHLVLKRDFRELRAVF